MSTVEDLIRAYERFVKLPWDPGVAYAQRVWMAVYPPNEERRVRFRLQEFEIATKAGGHAWKCFDLTEEFAKWMAAQEYRDSYFESPDDMEFALQDFAERLAEVTKRVLTAEDVDDSTLVALVGVGTLFGLSRVSVLIEAVNEYVRGRLLILFPGERDGDNYRLLEARDGWNYRAIPITATEEPL